MNLRRIGDIAKELQTDDLKLKIYRQIEGFVHKYHTHYFPHFKGELNDLVADIFEEFCRPKKHRNGETFSELDRLDISKVGGGNWTGSDDKAIATYTKRYVIARLIDKERSDKREVNADENYDEKRGRLTLDRAARGGKNTNGMDVDSGNEGAYVANINTTFYDLMEDPVALKKAKRTLLNDPDKVKRIQYLAKHYHDKLDPDVINFIDNLVGLPEEPLVAPKEEIKTDLKGVLGSNVEVVSYKLQNRPALKVKFPDKEAQLAAKDKQEQVINSMKEDGYEFYKAQGPNWYFFAVQ